MLYISLSTLLCLHPTNFHTLYFHFHSADHIILFPLKLPLCHMDYLEKCCLIYEHMAILLLSFCYWILVWFHYSHRTHSVISILLNFLKFILWLRIFSIFVYALWKLGKNVYSVIVGWSVHKSQFNSRGQSCRVVYIFAKFSVSFFHQLLM